MAKMPHPDLAAAFERLEEKGLQWCVLRLPPHPGRTGGDIDLLVDPSDAAALPHILRQQGFVELKGWPGGQHFLRYAMHTDTWLWLHFVTRLAFGRAGELSTGLESVCLARRQTFEGIPMLADNDGFWALMLHCLLDKGGISPRHRPVLTHLVSAATAENELAQYLSRICPPDAVAGRIMEAVRTEDWDSLGQLAPKLAANARRSARRGSMLQKLMRAVGKIPRQIATSWHQRGLAVALLGPDGAGKSTLIDGVSESFIFPVKSVYMGLTGGLLRHVDRLPLPVLVVCGRLIVLWGRYAIAQYHKARGRLVLFDRYTYDASVPTPYPLDRLHRAIRRIDGRACPPPDLVLLLDAPGTVMHARKGEYTPEMLEDWRQHFLALQQRCSQLQVIDATQPGAAVRADAVERIWQCYAARWHAGSA
jgi:thymidylate kinase